MHARTAILKEAMSRFLKGSWGKEKMWKKKRNLFRKDFILNCFKEKIIMSWYDCIWLKQIFHK